MKIIVLSAFRTFGKYLANSSELVAQRLNGTDINEYKICSFFLDAKIPFTNRGKELLSYASSLGAERIISLGMSSEKNGLCVETVARNRIYNEKYCAPELNNTRVDISRPYEERLPLNLYHWNLYLFRDSCEKNGIAIMPESSDAGGFCCNHLAYQMRVAQLNSEAFSRIPTIFIHIPCSPEVVSNPKEFYGSGKFTMSITEIATGIETLVLTTRGF